jgi:hypothetical protein
MRCVAQRTGCVYAQGDAPPPPVCGAAAPSALRGSRSPRAAPRALRQTHPSTWISAARSGQRRRRSRTQHTQPRWITELEGRARS